MTKGWYIEHRVKEQRDGFYNPGRARHEKAVSRLRLASFVLVAIAALLGVAVGSFDMPSLSPWIGVATTVGALVITQGLLDRRQYLAASCGAMAVRLDRLQGEYAGDLQRLVDAVEDLLCAEHKAWTDRMKQTHVAPAVAQASEHGPGAAQS
jgi:hypothetical protein